MSGAGSRPLDGARAGDTAAFAEMFERLRPRVFAIATRLVGPAEAEDVVMDTFLKVWDALPQLRRPLVLDWWVCRIAHNCAVDRLRARQTRSAQEDPRVEVAELPDRKTARPDREAAAADDAAQVAAALQELSPEHRTTLLLRFADGLSYAEIAAATGVSIGTVMSRLFYARRRLRRLLAAAGEEPP